MSTLCTRKHCALVLRTLMTHVDQTPAVGSENPKLENNIPGRKLKFLSYFISGLNGFLLNFNIFIVFFSCENQGTQK